MVDAAAVKRILYVEDHTSFREALTRILVDWGYEVEATAYFADALKLALTGRFCLLLIDVGLPDGNGVELCRRIRALDPATPIVLYSINDSFAADSLKAGAQTFIVKDVDLIDQLSNALIMLLPAGQRDTA